MRLFKALMLIGMLTAAGYGSLRVIAFHLWDDTPTADELSIRKFRVVLASGGPVIRTLLGDTPIERWNSSGDFWLGIDVQPPGACFQSVRNRLLDFEPVHDCSLTIGREWSPDVQRVIESFSLPPDLPGVDRCQLVTICRGGQLLYLMISDEMSQIFIIGAK